MAGPIMKEYISATSKSFISNNNNGKMIEKNFIEIEGTFLLKIHDNPFHGNDGKNVFKHINSFLEFYNLCEHDEEEETDDDNDPGVIDNVPEIFKIDDDLFNFDSPLCIAFEEFNHLLKIDPDLFTYDIQGFKTSDIDGFCNGGELPRMPTTVMILVVPASDYTLAVHEQQHFEIF
ncbi:hypothetical protein Tco_0003183 [Tanacetum coccineum]